MDSAAGAPRWKALGRAVTITAAGLFLVAFLGVGFLFLSSFGISQVAANARDLHWTNAALGSSGIARASVAQAVFFSFDERLGVSSAEARDTAIEEASLNLAAVSEHLGSPDAPDAPDLIAEGQSLIDEGLALLQFAAAGRPDEAEATRLETFEPAFQRLTDALSARQSELAEAIADSQETNGRIARTTELAITLLIPGSAMLVFWIVLRRRVRRQQLDMQLRIEAEKEVSRAKDDLIAGLSHELRTPLTSIVGFSNLLIEGDIDPIESAEMLALINAGSTDLSRMVEDLLVAARIDAGALSYSPKRVDLGEQARHVIAPYVRTGDAIELRMPPIEVYADPLLVRQILHNLVSNARKHGGDRIIVSGNLEGSHAFLVVADNGPGLPLHVEENLFHRFVNKGHEALISGSVGLGLAICKELAQNLGGSIRYKRIDDWTTFTVRFRSLPDAIAASAPVSDESVGANV